MVRVICQSTFDSVVKENVDDLEMSLADAVQDAKEQFTAQGVSLSNIVFPSEGSGEHKVVKAIEDLKALLDSKEDKFEEMNNNCDIIAQECSKGLAERVLATSSKGYEVLVECAEGDGKVKVGAVKALTELMNGNPDPLEAKGFKVLLIGLNSEDPALVEASLECVLNCCVRCEINRQNLVRNGLVTHLDRLLDTQPVRVSRIWQALVQDDDVRVPFGSAHDHARMIVEDHEGLKKLTKAITETSPSSSDLLQYLACLSSLTVRNEYCQSVVNDGGLKVLLTLLIEPDQDKEVVREALRLIKTLAGNDNVKKEIQDADGVPVIVNAMSKHVSVKSVCHMGCGAITAICLRHPENAKQVVSSGGAQLLTQILKIHVDAAKIMTACCSAIRNIVSRSKELIAEFTSLEIEPLLHQVKSRHPTTEDAVKAALRDLNLKVDLKEQWTGGLVKQDVD